MYVIAGVTGHTGKVAADTLLAQKQPVRVIVRKPEQGEPWKARGAEVALASLDDEAALTRAFTGAKGAFVLIPPDVTTQDYFGRAERMARAIAAAVTSAKLPHVVLLSSIGAHLPSGTGPIAGLHITEKALAATGAGTTFVRASYFLENYGGVKAAVTGDGVLPSFMPAGFSHEIVATHDIGETAARALLDGPRGQRVIDLTGPKPGTPADVAAAMGKILGRQIKVVEAPLAAVVPTFLSFGMSQQMAELYREMTGAFLDGTIRPDGKGELVRGKVGLEDGLRPLMA
jgi:uncharacterized protein YbjT (DUF2867 family)